MFLAHGGIVVDIVAAGGELEGERPDNFVVIDIVRIAENAPEVGKLEAGELAGDEMIGFGVAEEGGRCRVVLQDAIETLQVGSEDVVRLDENAIFARADDGVGLRGMLDGGDITFCIGDKIVLRDTGGEFREGIEGLASGFALLGDVADEVSRLQTVIPFVDVGVSETDIEAMFVDGVFKIWLAGVFAGVVAPDTFVRKGEIAVRTGEGDSVALEEFAGVRKPVVVAADEAFVVFAYGEDGATVLVRIDFAALAVDGAGDFFVE